MAQNQSADKLMNKAKTNLILCFLWILLFCCNGLIVAKSSSENVNAKADNFHLQNAEDKLRQHQFAYAWGELAYLVCQTPNHHVALQHMLEIAPLINKQAELKIYLEKAIKLDPNDQVLTELYNSFLVSQSELSSK